jgi:hypothetical protein
MRVVAVVALAACGSRAPSSPTTETIPELTHPLVPPETDPVMPACSQDAAAPAEPERVLATVARTACFGFCPVYEVVVYRDGLVQYTGHQNVLTCTGAAHLDPEQLSALEGLFIDAAFMRLADRYVSPDATDAPTIITTYSPQPGTTKRVEHYTGDRKVPEVLEALEERFIEIIDIDQFIGTERDRMRAWRR